MERHTGKDADLVLAAAIAGGKEESPIFDAESQRDTVDHRDVHSPVDLRREGTDRVPVTSRCRAADEHQFDVLSRDHERRGLRYFAGGTREKLDEVIDFGEPAAGSHSIETLGFQRQIERSGAPGQI